MKLRKLPSNSPMASREDALGITLYVRESDGKIVYKGTDGTVIEVMDGASSTITTLQSDVATALTAADLGGYTYTEVAVSSAEILTLYSSPVELLPAPGANSYYEWATHLEYTHGGTDYSWTMSYVDLSGILVSSGIITSRGNARAETASSNYVSKGTNSEIFTIALQESAAVNQPLTMGGTVGTAGDPTTGNGTLLVKIWYKVKTFGTEL